MWFTDVLWPDFTPGICGRRWTSSRLASGALAVADPSAEGAATPARRSDLPVRVARPWSCSPSRASPWRDGVVLDCFIALVALRLWRVRDAGEPIATDPARLGAAAITGAFYIGWAALALIVMPTPLADRGDRVGDLHRYRSLFHRARAGWTQDCAENQPSKTWPALPGGMAAAGIWLALVTLGGYMLSALGPTGPSLKQALAITNVGVAALAGAGWRWPRRPAISMKAGSSGGRA
jgi:phosphatidate cytidylyltransferase